MSALHAYCIRRATDPPPPPGLLGVGGAPVQTAEAGALTIWLSRGSDRPGPEELRAHDAVVREGMKSRTLLPLRFGTSFRDAEAARDAVLEREQEFIETLDWLGQRVEMGLRVARLEKNGTGDDTVKEEAPPHARSAPSGRGRAFLEERRRALREQEAALAGSREILAALAAEVTDLDAPMVQTALPGPEVVGMLAHLVHRGAVTAYRRRGQELQLAHPELRISVTGPWAPYSFVAPGVEVGEGVG